MFRIEDGREHFWQWDSNQRLIVDDAAITEAHFSNKTDDFALVCEVFSENGKRLVNVPNILLQDDWRIRVYAFMIDHTVVEDCFKVVTRSKPDSYIYEETEVLNYGTLAERVRVLENSEEVYIGYEQPTESSVKLWIDPDDAMEIDLTGYATEQYVNDAISAINIPDTSGFITMEDVEAKGYALKTDIPDTSGFALKSDIPDTSGLTTMAAVEAKGYQTEEEVATAINNALSAIGIAEEGAY